MIIPKTPYGRLKRSLQILLSPLSMRSEERIRELCAKVVAASDTEVQNAIAELKKALRERKSTLENGQNLNPDPK